MRNQDRNLDQIAIRNLRALIIDTINNANSGHPGMALDIAPLVYLLYKNHLIADPANPSWIKRDRFVLSAGHTCAVLYSMLHLAGYPIALEDLKKFRQLDSLLPGHPEVGHTPGIDASAGPLGQGIAQAVGFAMAERALVARFPDSEALLGHHTFCLCGDGCLQEGLGQEAISLAGHLKLSKLILFYDENQSTLDGPTADSMSEDVKLRFLGCGWNVLEVGDGNDLDALDEAIEEAKAHEGSPTLVIVHTKIGYGTSLEGNHKCHGSPLGKEIGASAKANYGFDLPEFSVEECVYETLRESFAKRGHQAYEAYLQEEKVYEAAHPGRLEKLRDMLQNGVDAYLPAAPEFGPKEASRATNGKYVAALQKECPFFLGGSADVASSVKTAVPGDPGFSSEHYEAKNVNWGIREFGMASAQNGILLHGGLRSYVGCFLVFADYMKPAIRMAAMERLPAIYLFSHDSVCVGEDGPTHQPIEQLAMLRSIPRVEVFRPADAREAWYSWEEACKSKDHPVCLILSRQDLPLLEKSSKEGVEKGAYIVYSPKDPKKVEYQIIAT
ncbi:MAG: transketolase, partial [Bacilli bacterium]|nr:transketolase [Bacilli bacterium]